MISGHGNIETAVSAIKKGAYDFIEKALQGRSADSGGGALAGGVHPSPRGEGAENPQRPEQVMVGKSGPMTSFANQLDRVAPTQRPRAADRRPWLRQGTSRACASRCVARADGPFVVLNAAMITPEGMEEALFGGWAADGRGRRTGARWRRRMAARSILTRSPTCRARRRTRFCAC